jgi:DNA-3-methyladenine glycosylase II
MTFSQKLRQAERHLQMNDKRLAIVIKSSGPCRLKPHTDHYGELVGSIVGQQLSAVAAGAIWRRVLDLFDGQMPNDQLVEQLTAVKGLGEWSAHMFMIFGLGRLDVLPVGDLGVRKAMMNLYELKELPDPAMCVTIANKYDWHPYESVAAWYLWQSLDNNPQKKSRHGA